MNQFALSPPPPLSCFSQFFVKGNERSPRVILNESLVYCLKTHNIIKLFLLCYKLYKEMFNWMLIHFITEICQTELVINISIKI